MTTLSNGHSPVAVPPPLHWPSETEHYVVAGALLYSKELLPIALEHLTSSDFFDRRHEVIFEAMTEMHAAGDSIDRPTVCEYLTRAECLEAAGGKGMLELLDGSVPELGNYRRYVLDVKLAALDREEVGLAGEIANGSTLDRTRDENRRDLAAVIAARIELETPEPWPFLPSPVLPAFPLEALPDVVARLVEAVAEHTQTPPDLAAFAALGVLSAASLGAKVDCGNGWEEELALYLMAVLVTGDRKSSVLKPIVQPLRRAQQESRDAAKPDIARLKAKLGRLEARRASLTKKYGGTEDPELREELERELDEVAVEIDEVGEPVLPRLLADDATPEALGGLLARHGKIAVIAAEAPLMDNLIGRYDKSSSANLHLVCQASEGEATSVDRRGREAEQLERPLLTISLSVQPHVLRKLVEHELARQQGLVARFAYALPKSKRGTREQTTEPVPIELREAWDDVVKRLISLNPLTEPTQPGSVSSVSNQELGILRLSLSLSARNLLTALRAEQEPQLADGGELSGIADWIARHAARTARIAGLIHLAAGYDTRKPIAGDTMARALKIGEYLLAHGRAAIEQPDPSLRRALEWLEGRAERTVTQRDLQRGPLNSRGTAEEAGQLVRRLINAGALRPLESARPPLGRPPSPAFAVNPRIWEKDTSARADVVKLRPHADARGSDAGTVATAVVSGGHAA